MFRYVKTLQLIEKVHRSIDNTGIQRIYKSCITELFGEFFIAKISRLYACFIFAKTTQVRARTNIGKSPADFVRQSANPLIQTLKLSDNSFSKLLILF